MSTPIQAAPGSVIPGVANSRSPLFLCDLTVGQDGESCHLVISSAEEKGPGIRKKEEAPKEAFGRSLESEQTRWERKPSQNNESFY